MEQQSYVSEYRNTTITGKMNLFSKLRHLVRGIWNNLFLIFQIILVVLLVALVVVFVVVMVPDCPKWIFGFLGIAQNREPKYEALKFLGIGMGGVLVALQALMSYKRAKAMEDTAKSQADAVLKTEQGQRQDRLKNAIEHLGHESESVRLGGAYELFHLAKDTLDEDTKEKLSQTVLDILCAHIRQTTGKAKYRGTHKSKPSEEVQSLLTLLFVQEYEIFKGCHINLQGSWLNGVNLKEARLKKAVLTEAHLQGADLSGADLQRAYLIEAHLQGANLSTANLQRALLREAHLQGAWLSWARLQEAWLLGAQLQAATLREAHLQRATLDTAQLQGAWLHGTQLQEADLAKADLRGAQSQIKVSPKFSQRMRELIGQESDLSGAIFEGGLSREYLDSLVEGFPDKKAKELREKLESHIGKPANHQPPKNAIPGAYKEEDAEKWIAEYNEAMSSVPKEDTD